MRAFKGHFYLVYKVVCFTEKTWPLRHTITKFSLANMSPSAFQEEAAQLRVDKEQ